MAKGTRSIDAMSMPRKGARFGGVTSANSKGMPINQSANNKIGNGGPSYGKNVSRPIVTGTQGPRSGAKFGNTQKRTKGVA